LNRIGRDYLYSVTLQGNSKPSRSEPELVIAPIEDRLFTLVLHALVNAIP
jgi:hypothetical protein